MKLSIDPGKALWVGLLLALLTSCNQAEEGCLDIFAANYNVDADRPCPDCCTYPSNRVDIQHKVVNGDEAPNLEFDTLLYYDGAGQRFGLLSLKFYLSELHLVRPNGEFVRSTDTIGLRFPQAPGDTLIQSMEDNFALADPSNYRQRIMGRLRTDGQFEQVRILLGMNEPAISANPLYIPVEHPLSDTSMYLFEDAAHLFTRLELFTIHNPGDTTRTLLQIRGEENRKELFFPASFYLDPGFSPRVVLQVDYQKWFDVLDLNGLGVEEMEARLAERIPSSIELISVSTTLD